MLDSGAARSGDRADEGMDMGKRLYVGNIPFSASEDELREAFAAHGEVTAVDVIMDRETGRSRGFGFVEFNDAEQGKAAIEGMNLQKLDDRALTVNEARPRADRGGRGGGGGGRRGGGGGGRW